MKKFSHQVIALLPVLLAMNGCALLRGHGASLRDVRLRASQDTQPDAANALASARALLAKEDYVSAISRFRQIPAGTPESAAAANGLAIAYAALGRDDLAQRYFEQAMGLDWTNESYRRNYDRFTAAHRVSAPTLVEETARPAESTRPGVINDRSTLARLSLNDVRLAIPHAKAAAAALAPPSEIRLSLAGAAPKLIAPDASPPRVMPTSHPMIASAADLAQAVQAARLRRSRASNDGSEAKRCSDSGASSCIS